MNKVVEVAVAAIVNQNNEVLISRRPDNVHLGGLWEFPGGKLEVGESIEQALQREIMEELEIRIESAKPLITLRHNYKDRRVRLHVWLVEQYSSQNDLAFKHGSGSEGQQVKWQSLPSLNPAEFPAADKSIITALQLPEQYLITGNFKSLEDFETRILLAMKKGIRLLQLRLKLDWFESNKILAVKVLNLAVDVCKNNQAVLMLNVPEALRKSVPPAILEGAGFHMDSGKLQTADQEELSGRPESRFLSASCHTRQDIEKAQSIGVDFIVLSPVQKTASHPEATPLGWQKFATLVESCDIPVYALGGVDESHIAKACACGAQGISGIGYCW